MVLVMFLCFLVLVLKCIPSASFLIIAPEDVSTGLAAVYGFTPRIVKGNDHRVGFGFRFGNHADLQVLYELGPQIRTRPLKRNLSVRSTAYRQRIIRRRPLIEFLVRAGLLDLKDEQFDVELQSNDEGYVYDEPRR